MRALEDLARVRDEARIHPELLVGPSAPDPSSDRLDMVDQVEGGPDRVATLVGQLAGLKRVGDRLERRSDRYSRLTVRFFRIDNFASSVREAGKEVIE